MKRTLIAVVFFGLMCCSARAFDIPLPFDVYNIGEKVTKVHKLPKTDQFMMKNPKGKMVHVDFGVLHKQFAILEVPLWNYGEKKYVLYHKGWFGRTMYRELSSDEVKALHEYVGAVPETPEIPFRVRVGGKIIALLCLLVFVFTSFK